METENISDNKADKKSSEEGSEKQSDTENSSAICEGIKCQEGCEEVVVSNSPSSSKKIEVNIETSGNEADATISPSNEETVEKSTETSETDLNQDENTDKVDATSAAPKATMSSVRSQKRKGKRKNYRCKNMAMVQATVPSVLGGLKMAYCYVCNYTLYSTFKAVKHFQSRQHLLRVQMMEIVARQTNEAAALAQNPGSTENKFYCNICRKFLNSAQQYSMHIESNRHQKKVEEHKRQISGQGNKVKDGKMKDVKKEKSNTKNGVESNQETKVADDVEDKEKVSTNGVEIDQKQSKGVDDVTDEISTEEENKQQTKTTIEEGDKNEKMNTNGVENNEEQIKAQENHVEENMKSNSVNGDGPDQTSRPNKNYVASVQEQSKSEENHKQSNAVETNQEKTKTMNAGENKQKPNKKTLPEPSEMDFRRYNEWLMCSWSTLPQGRGRAINQNRRANRGWQSNIGNSHQNFNYGPHYMQPSFRGRARGSGRQHPHMYNHPMQDERPGPQQALMNYNFSEFGQSQGYM